MDALNILLIINLCVLGLTAAFQFYQAVYTVAGIFSKQKFKTARRNHKFAYLIPARNEEQVIGNLIKSIFKQNYPKELIRVFVVADNCTDKTAKAAEENGATVYERFNEEKKGKSYALDFLFKKIKENHGSENFDGYFIFDADNLLDSNYTLEINKALDSGLKIVAGYRNIKNFDKTWVTAAFGMVLLRENRFLHLPRAKFKNSTHVTGTGYLIAREIIEATDGWAYNHLTEDIQFSLDNILKGEKIGFNYNAVFYDEQPEKFSETFSQRKRWLKGYYQCIGSFCVKFFKRLIFKKDKFTSFDMFVSYFPLPLIGFSWMLIYTVLANILWYFKYPADFFRISYQSPFWGLIIMLISAYLFLVLYGGLLLFLERKLIKKCGFFKKIYFCLMWPIFLSTFIPLIYISLFTKPKWMPTQHSSSVAIEDIVIKISGN